MKKKRQEKIIEIITKYEVETQEELAKKLNEAGYSVTQATVSRDIREMSLVKIPGIRVKQRYTSPVEHAGVSMGKHYTGVLQDGVVSMEQAGNILVIKTVSGMAMAVAAAIDDVKPEGMVGSIAGDDTVMCAIKSEEKVRQVMRCIQQLIDQIKV